MKWLLVLNGGQDFPSAVFLQDDCAEICFVNPKSHQHFTTAICILLSTISKECQGFQVTRMKKSNKGKDKKKKRRKKEERKRRRTEKQTVDRIEERKEEWHERKRTKGKEERRRE